MASKVSFLGDEQEESMEALTRDLERLAISPDSTLSQSSSSQEETQSTTDAKPRVHNTPDLHITLTKAK